jgi:phosphate transport system permease protein
MSLLTHRASNRPATRNSSLSGTVRSLPPLPRLRGPGPLQRWRERAIQAALFLAAASSIAITLGIVGILGFESLAFFKQVSLFTFLTDTQWTPLFDDAHYGIMPLVAGTATVAAVALCLALPVGTITAIYLSEYAPHRVREGVKPFLELLTAVPTVVYGYFALLFVTPLLRHFIPSLPGFNMLSAGLVIGVMIIPYVSSFRKTPCGPCPCTCGKPATPWAPRGFRRPPGSFSPPP